MQMHVHRHTWRKIIVRAHSHHTQKKRDSYTRVHHHSCTQTHRIYAMNLFETSSVWRDTNIYVPTHPLTLTNSHTRLPISPRGLSNISANFAIDKDVMTCHSYW